VWFFNGFVGTLITKIKGFAKGRNAAISLERNINGEVVIKSIKFVIGKI
jgi:hypothetical protein